MNAVNRRRHERFAVIPAYTACKMRRHENERYTLEGHVHDMSEGGVRFECDLPIDPGTTLSLQIELPERYGDTWTIDGPGRSVFVTGNVIWCDSDEAGPAVMALAITRFAREGDRGRLLRRLAQGGFARMTA